MALIDAWGTPTAGGTAAIDADPGAVSYANGYWFALIGDGVDPYNTGLRYATDPLGTWSTVTLPSLPGTADTWSQPYPFDDVIYADGEWAFALTSQSGATLLENWIIHTSDPTGAWSKTSIGTAHKPARQLRWDGSQWFVHAPTYIGASTAITGTWTWTDMGTVIPTGQELDAVEFGDPFYVLHSSKSWPVNARTVMYSTALTSGWATISPTPPTQTSTSSGFQFRLGNDGKWWWYRTDTATDGYYWTADPSTTWTLTDGTAMGDPATGLVTLYHVDGSWLAYGTALYQAETTGGPIAAFSSITTPGSSSDYVNDLAYHGGTVVALNSIASQIYVAAYTATAAKYLRQRQSPRATPQRLGRSSLRQRQTFR